MSGQRRAGAIWVVNRELGEVTVFEADSGEPLATVPTGLGAHEVGVSNRTNQAYVSNESEDTISILSTRTLAAREITLGPRPHHLEPSRNGRAIVVGLVGSNQIGVIDAASDLTSGVRIER